MPEKLDKSTPIKKLSDKSTKQEMLEAYQVLAKQLEAAYQKVQDIAEKTVEGSSQAKSLADLQKLLLEQGRKGNADKG